MKDWVKNVIRLVIFCVCIIIIIVGQKTVGPLYLLLELVGLVGLLGLLFDYNRKYQ